MDEAFARAVEDGLKLTKRLVLPNGGGLPPPRPHMAMDRDNDPAAALLQLMPASPMAYAVVVDPGAVDSPDVPSYQPHVYGRLDPPALIPLQMREVELRVDCAAAGCATAEVALRARWWVHCITRSRACHCRIVVPMGHQVQLSIPALHSSFPCSLRFRSVWGFFLLPFIIDCCY